MVTAGHQDTHTFGLFAALFTEGQISVRVCVQQICGAPRFKARAWLEWE